MRYVGQRKAFCVLSPAVACPAPPAAQAPHAPPPDVAAAAAADGPRPAAALQELFDSSPVFGAPAAASQPAAAAALASLASAGHLLQSAAWHAYGCSSLAHLHAVIHLACYAEASSPDDRACAYAQLAQLAAARRGAAAAQQLIASVEPQFELEVPAPLAAVKLALAHDAALARGELHVALAACEEMALLRQHDAAAAVELSLEAQRRGALTLAARGDAPAAHAAAGALFARCVDAGLQRPAVQALLALARVHLGADAPAAALPYALSALLHCQLLGFAPLAGEAALALAEALVALAPAPDQAAARHAAALVAAELPFLLAEGGLELRSRAAMLLADVALTCEGDGASSDGSGTDANGAGGSTLPPGLDAAQLLQVAVDGFGRLRLTADAARACHALALLHHRRGALTDRDAAAERFHHIMAGIQ